jgi:hypothetical protein
MSPRSTSTAGKSDKPATKAGKTAANNSPRRPAQPNPRPGVKHKGLVSAEDRKRFVAEAAYFKAERRGFAEGSELEDWVEAEAEIDALLDSRGAS